MFSYYWSSLLCLLWQNENTWICDPSISALFLHCILFAHNAGFLNKAESIYNPVYFKFAGVCNCWLATCVMLYHLQAWGSCYWGDYFHCLEEFKSGILTCWEEPCWDGSTKGIIYLYFYWFMGLWSFLEL